MKQNLRPYDRVVRFILGIFFIWVGIAIFEHPAARIVSVIFGFFMLWECATSFCWLYWHLGQRTATEPLRRETNDTLTLIMIQLIMAYVWLTSGWNKLTDPEFVRGMSKTLERFAGENPFGYYKSFLTTYAMPNAETFGHLVVWGEIASGAALVVGAITLVYTTEKQFGRLAYVTSSLGLAGGAFLNAMFYFAAGWMSPSTHGLNLVMFLVQIILLQAWLSRFLPRRTSS